MKWLFLFMVMVTILPACSPEPRDIDYGEDICAYCKMTIVDAQYGAEAVTTKGRVHVFDAVECMVHFTNENTDVEYAHLLVNHYTDPGALNDATKSGFLISEALPSPMGAFGNGTSAQPTLVRQEIGRK